MENTDALVPIPDCKWLILCKLKDVEERADDRVLNLSHANVPAELLSHGCDAAVLDPAGNNQAKPRQVGADVQREPVARHPPRDPDADCGELRLASVGTRPDPRQSLHASRANAECRDRANQRFLEVPDVPMDVAPVGLEIDYRVAHELSRAVISDVAAAAGLEERHPRSRE